MKRIFNLFTSAIEALRAHKDEGTLPALEAGLEDIGELFMVSTFFQSVGDHNNVSIMTEIEVLNFLRELVDEEEDSTGIERLGEFRDQWAHNKCENAFEWKGEAYGDWIVIFHIPKA